MSLYSRPSVISRHIVQLSWKTIGRAYSSGVKSSAGMRMYIGVCLWGHARPNQTCKGASGCAAQLHHVQNYVYMVYV